MGDLFSRAGSVIAWLGPADRLTRKGLLVVDRLALLYNRQVASVSIRDNDADSLPPLISLEDVLHPSLQQSKLGIEPILLGEWVLFMLFFCRSYFSRMWVAQGLALGNQIIGICGSELVDWDKLVAAAKYYTRNSWIGKWVLYIAKGRLGLL